MGGADEVPRPEDGADAEAEGEAPAEVVLARHPERTEEAEKMEQPEEDEHHIELIVPPKGQAAGDGLVAPHDVERLHVANPKADDHDECQKGDDANKDIRRLAAVARELALGALLRRAPFDIRSLDH